MRLLRVGLGISPEPQRPLLRSGLLSTARLPLRLVPELLGFDAVRKAKVGHGRNISWCSDVGALLPDVTNSGPIQSLSGGVDTKFYIFFRVSGSETCPHASLFPEEQSQATLSV